MQGITIKTLSPSAWAQYKALRLRALLEDPQAFLSMYEKSKNDPDEKWINVLEKAEVGESQWYLFAKVGEKLVGMVGAFVDEQNAIEIIAMYVVKEARGQGIATRLLQELLKIVMDKRNGRRILVSANEEQIAAVSLYKRFGFKEIASKPLQLGDGKTHNVTLMELT